MPVRTEPGNIRFSVFLLLFFVVFPASPASAQPTVPDGFSNPGLEVVPYGTSVLSRSVLAPSAAALFDGNPLGRNRARLEAAGVTQAMLAVNGGDRVIDFPYQDRTLLGDGQARSSRVWVPVEAWKAGGAYPLIVLLHGIETGESVRRHRLLPATQDLSRVARALILSGRIGPVILAAPSQTVRAGWSATLWTPRGFDLAGFVRTVDRVLRNRGAAVRVNRSQVSVFGHSGAGCGYGKNGLYRIALQARTLASVGIRIRVLGLMDTCFMGWSGGALLRRSLAGTRTRVFGMWVDPVQWGRVNYRRVHSFVRAAGFGRRKRCRSSRYLDCRRNRRGWQMVRADRQALQDAFQKKCPGGRCLAPHSALPYWFMDEALKTYFKK